MAEESGGGTVVGDAVAAGRVESPPGAPQPARGEADEPRARLHQLAERLRGAVSRGVLAEYLRLRRSLM